MRRAVWLVLAAAQVTCYSPHFNDCGVRCGEGQSCPSGASCLDDGYCHASPMDDLCCTPRACGAMCGDLPDDGCGHPLHCGDCDPPMSCGGGGPNVCGTDPCTPITECPPGACGRVSDTCAGTLDCGACPADAGTPPDIDGGLPGAIDGGRSDAARPADGGTPGPVVSNDPMAMEHLVGVSPLTLDANETYDLLTDSGKITRRAISSPAVVREPGVGVHNGIGFYSIGGIGVFAVDGLLIADGARLLLYGDDAFLLLSSGDVVINGFIDAAAGGCPDGMTGATYCPGPGGGYGADLGSPATGCAPGGDASIPGPGTGGGGGGLGKRGGDGGGNVLFAGGAGGAPGAACPGPELVPLRGGSGGGDGAYGVGGGGGGAAQITSLTAIRFTKISDTCGLTAGGEGGDGDGSGGGGGGGGAGGAILVEAPLVEIGDGCWLAANGGGGGDGAGHEGQTGRLSATPALGGSSYPYGGNGGAGVTPAEDGSQAGAQEYSGGGGGGVGIVRINATTHTGGETTTSPPATFGPLPTR